MRVAPSPPSVLILLPFSSRFGLFRPAAKAFFELHQNDVATHNAAHDIASPAHNRIVPDQVWTQLKELAR